MNDSLSLPPTMRFVRSLVICLLVVGFSSLVAGTKVVEAQAIHRCLPASSPDSTAFTMMREAISIVGDTSAGARSLRAEFGIPARSAADVSIVQDDAVCDAAMSAFEALTGKQFSETFVVARLGEAAPFSYLMTPRRNGALSARYLLNGTFALLTMISGDG